MSNRAAGVAFVCIAVFIFATPYFVTAIWVSGVGVSLQVFNELFLEICLVPLIVSVFMLGGGIFYLIRAEKTDA